MKENEWLLGMELLSLQRRKHKARLRCDLKPFSLCLLPFYKPNHTHIFFNIQRNFLFLSFWGPSIHVGVWDMGRLWVCETRGGCGCVPNFRSENDHTMLEDILKEGYSIETPGFQIQTETFYPRLWRCSSFEIKGTGPPGHTFC